MAVTASITLTENSYSVANNTSSVTCKVVVKWTAGSNDRNNLTKTLNFAGSTYTTTTNINSNQTTSGSLTLFNKTKTITHNSDGTKSVSANVTIPTRTSSGTVTASKSLTLTPIPRYATITQSLNWKNENSITMNWSANATIDYLWYSINGGSSWVAIGNPSASSGKYTISGLSQNTTYSIKTRVRRKDSQLVSDSAAATQATYAYPYANSLPSFTLGNNLTIGIYNPLGRTYRVTFIANDNTEFAVDRDYTQTQLTFTESAWANWIDFFYQSIPNAKSGTYKVKITYIGHAETRTGGTYTANVSTASPTFSGATYQDTNSTVTAITGDNQKLLPTRSTIKFDISGITARLYATISGSKVALNGTNYNMTVSGATATVSNVPLNSSGQNAVITLTDSRGLTYSQTVNLDIVDYTAPSVSATAERDAGFYSETDITPTVNYTSVGSNAVTVNLKARKVGTSTYTVDQNIPDGSATQVILDNEYAWEILLTATDTLGGVGTYNITIARGLPLMYFDTNLNSVGINQFPSNQDSLEITGDVYINSNKIDYIVEQGVSGIWTYRKWASGFAECWGTYTNTISGSTVSNGNYINYPFTFTAVPCIALGLNAGGADLYDAHMEQSGTTATQVRLTMINRYTASVVMKVCLDVKGKWQ